MLASAPPSSASLSSSSSSTFSSSSSSSSVASLGAPAFINTTAAAAAAASDFASEKGRAAVQSHSFDGANFAPSPHFQTTAATATATASDDSLRTRRSSPLFEDPVDSTPLDDGRPPQPARPGPRPPAGKFGASHTALATVEPTLPPPSPSPAPPSPTLPPAPSLPPVAAAAPAEAHRPSRIAAFVSHSKHRLSERRPYTALKEEDPSESPRGSPLESGQDSSRVEQQQQQPQDFGRMARPSSLRVSVSTPVESPRAHSERMVWGADNEHSSPLRLAPIPTDSPLSLAMTDVHQLHTSDAIEGGGPLQTAQTGPAADATALPSVAIDMDALSSGSGAWSRPPPSPHEGAPRGTAAPSSALPLLPFRLLAQSSLAAWAVKRLHGLNKNALKVAVQTLVAVALGCSFAFLGAFGDYFGSTGSWIIVTVLVVIESNLGSSVKKAIYRIAGTVLGGLAAIAFLQIVFFASGGVCLNCGGGERAVGLSVLLTVWCFFVAYFKVTHTDAAYAAQLAMLTIPIVILPAYYQNDPSPSNGLARITTIIMGSVIGFLVSSFVFPVRSSDQIRKGLAQTIFDLAGILPRVVTLACLEEDEHEAFLLTESIFAQFRKVIRSLESERSMIVSASGEIFLHKPHRFPEPVFQDLLRYTRRMFYVSIAMFYPSLVQEDEDIWSDPILPHETPWYEPLSKPLQKMSAVVTDIRVLPQKITLHQRSKSVAGGEDLLSAFNRAPRNGTDRSTDAGDVDTTARAVPQLPKSISLNTDLKEASAAAAAAAASSSSTASASTAASGAAGAAGEAAAAAAASSMTAGKGVGFRFRHRKFCIENKFILDKAIDAVSRSLKLLAEYLHGKDNVSVVPFLESIARLEGVLKEWRDLHDYDLLHSRLSSSAYKSEDVETYDLMAMMCRQYLMSLRAIARPVKTLDAIYRQTTHIPRPAHPIEPSVQV